MPRRPTTNRTKLPRIAGLQPHDAWIHFVCVQCGDSNVQNIGQKLLIESEAYETAEWKCANCGYVHSRNSGLPLEDVAGKDLPFKLWPETATLPGNLAVERFWRAFFRMSVAHKEYYWKQCNMCGRALPNAAFDRHVGWGPLEKQMECRSCKANINTSLNPRRTAQQLHESAVKRRAAELLLEGENKAVDIAALFKRFGSTCFKTGKKLSMKDRRTWAIDHILPSRWLYPLNAQNAALLSAEANSAKSDKWPTDFYTNEELIRLAKLTGGDLRILSSKDPIVNPKIDVNACVTRMLKVRSDTDLSRRIGDIRKLLEDYNLVEQLSDENQRLLGY